MGKGKLAKKGVEEKARGASNFIQILLVLACGAAAIYFMSGKSKQLASERSLKKKNAPIAAAEEGGKEPTIMEKLSGVASTNDRVTRKDREELDNLIDEVGK